jgi:hypothetical protein
MPSACPTFTVCGVSSELASLGGKRYAATALITPAPPTTNVPAIILLKKDRRVGCISPIRHYAFLPLLIPYLPSALATTAPLPAPDISTVFPTDGQNRKPFPKNHKFVHQPLGPPAYALRMPDRVA